MGREKILWTQKTGLSFFLVTLPWPGRGHLTAKLPGKLGSQGARHGTGGGGVLQSQEGQGVETDMGSPVGLWPPAGSGAITPACLWAPPGPEHQALPAAAASRPQPGSPTRERPHPCRKMAEVGITGWPETEAGPHSPLLSIGLQSEKLGGHPGDGPGAAW